jgi:predicted Rossmann fold flavoprotein
MSHYDVIVLGAGAAGLMAAMRAAQRGRRTLLIEKNKQAGVKILMSGGTRCNITQNTNNRGIIAAYGSQGKFLHSALAAFGVRESVEFFELAGVPTKIEESNKIFPVSNQASDVRDALVHCALEAGATIAYQESVVDLISNSIATPENSFATDGRGFGFTVKTSARSLTCESVILTTGGLSFPGSGTTGDGYPLAAKFGHTILPTRPALVPLMTNTQWAKDLMGLTMPDVTLSVKEENKQLSSRRSSLLFAHFGLTGPAALDVSREVSGHPTPQKLVATVDLLPDIKEPQLLDMLRDEAASNGKKQIPTWLATIVPRRIVDVLLQLASIPMEQKLAEVSKDQRNRLVRLIKSLPIPLSGTLGYKKAEVTAGGVSRDEVDSSTMQSKLAPGLFFAGEILDLDGPIGGYNFQAAWSTGWLAGDSA